MKIISLMLIVMVSLLFQACATKKLSENEAITKALFNCSEAKVTANISIHIIPSYGLLADALAISAVKISGNDGGFHEKFSSDINGGVDRIAIYSQSSQKMEALLSHSLSLYKDNELKNISLCILGIENSKELSNEATRTGSSIRFVP